MDTSPFPAFPKIYYVGGSEIPDLFKGPVEITEKVDGSQIGFGKDSDGFLVIRSKGRTFYNERENYGDADKLFKPAFEHILNIQWMLPKDTWFYGEAVCSPKHNTLKYGRTPKGYVALFGAIEKGVFVDKHYSLVHFADNFSMDVVPLLYNGEIGGPEEIKKFLERTSFLGNENIEGVVVKNYKQFSAVPYSTSCFGKYVSEKFKERHDTVWSSKGSDFDTFLASINKDARWKKSIQHFMDDSKLTDSPKDIGPLIVEIVKDFEEEEKENVKTILYKMYKKQITSHIIKGFPEHYKESLLSRSFEGKGGDGTSVVEQVVKAGEIEAV